MGRPRAWVQRQRELLAVPRNRVAAAILALGLVLGLTVVLISLFHGGRSRHAALPVTPPSPGESVSTVHSSPKARPKAGPSVTTAPAAAFRCSPAPASTGGSAPSRICIPALRVDASVMQLGLNPDRTVQVPPLTRVGDAGWYRYSATPGNVGATVILGHVDSATYGPGVFFALGRLHPGDKVLVSRGDGLLATFRVDRVTQVAKKSFPTGAVYGATARPEIRLVTCGGRFNSATGSYEDNIIAYGSLMTSGHA